MTDKEVQLVEVTPDDMFLDPLTFEDYQLSASKTAKYPEVGTGSWVAVTYCALGLGEAGELQGKVKKILRDDNFEITEEKREAIFAELGDVLWYAAQLSSELGFGLEDVALANLDKLADRKARGVIGGSGDNR